MIIRAAGGDPGLANLGLGLLDWSPQVRTMVNAYTVRTQPGPTGRRAATIGKVLLTIEAFDVLGIEDQERAWSGAQRAGKTSAKATLARVGEGMLRMWAIARGVPVLDVSPAQIRASLGLPSNASKADMWRVLAKLCGNVPKETSEHSRDALCIAWCTAQHWAVLRNLPQSAVRPI